MGYYTNYDLTVEYLRPLRKGVSEEIFEAISARIAEISDYRDPFKSDCKWYKHEEHMRRVSTEFPDILLTLNGEGEESRDIWVKYFLAGKMQIELATVKLGDFNPEKLK